MVYIALPHRAMSVHQQWWHTGGLPVVLLLMCGAQFGHAPLPRHKKKKAAQQAGTKATKKDEGQ